MELLKILYIIIGIIFVTIAPQFVQNTNVIWMVPRSTYPFASLLGILMLYLVMNYNTEGKAKYVKYTSMIIGIVILIMQFQKFNIIETDRYKVNAIDYEITKSICNKIDEYEESTGNKITKISVYQDKLMESTYTGVFTTGDINTKAYSSDWGTTSILKYYFGKQLTLISNNQEIQKQFEDKNWNSFNEEQLIFDNDTLHLCRY